MRVSLNLIKKYIDIKDIAPKQIAYDLTLRTVEVENVENLSDQFHDIVVGKIERIDKHPNADSLKVCQVDIGEKDLVQIVCGGSNLYEGEYVVVSKPGAEVRWHGEGDLVKIEKTKLRGVDSYGMICASSEVGLESQFPMKDDHEIVDLKKEYPLGVNIIEALDMNDTIIEIDNKSLTNRPDLWGHLGIAREIGAIYKLPLKGIPKYELSKDIKPYNVNIEAKDKCYRYIGVKIENVYDKESPKWMQDILTNCGMRPINAIVDITNYVMLAVGQPTHAFDSTHVDDETIIVRNAKKGEKLLLLDDNYIELTEDDLVICDTHEAMALAGIRGGKKDSILPETTSVLLEVANFTASTIRKTDKRFAEKTDSAMRYEKGLDTQRVDEGVNLALALFRDLFPECKITAYSDVYPTKTINEQIEVSQDFLNKRLGKVLSKETITEVLEYLGYEVEYKDGSYHVIVPTYRSTGDVSLKDDVMGDIARLLSFESFEAKPLTISIEHATIQNKVLLERRIREYLSYRCGFNEIFTYPWIDEKYINAAGINKDECVRLTTPPAPELEILRSSLVPGMLEAINKNTRYYDEFEMYEMTEVYHKGEYHESSEDETLPLQPKYLTGCYVAKDPKKCFYAIKGVLENMSKYCQIDAFTFKQDDKPSWADTNGYLSIIYHGKKIGYMGLISVKTLSESKIKRVNASIFEINVDELMPYASRTNTFEHLPLLPLAIKDLAIIVDDNITWADIVKTIKNDVKEVEFIEEYRGSQIPKGQKSIVFRFKIENNDTTMTSDEINNKMNELVEKLNKSCNARLRDF